MPAINCFLGINLIGKDCQECDIMRKGILLANKKIKDFFQKNVAAL
jgi:hypothetical protein